MQRTHRAAPCSGCSCSINPYARRRAPFGAVAVLVLLNIAAYLGELHAADPDRAIAAFALIPFDLRHNIVLAPPSPPAAALTLLTAMFVHGGLAHIAFNMIFLALFGPLLEGLIGNLRFGALYLVCGVLGYVAQAAIAPDSHIPSLGASGAVAGVLGAVAVRAPLLPLIGGLPAIVVIAAWAPLQFLAGFGALGAQAAESQTGTAYFAHIGGFCAGALLIGAFARGRTEQQ